MNKIADSFELARSLSKPDTGDALKFKWGNVVSINSDGKLNVQIAGYASTVLCTNWAAASVGSVVGVLCKKTNWIAIASNDSGLEIADFIVEKSENRDPSRDWVWEKYASGEIKARRIASIKPGEGNSKHPDIYGWYYSSTPHFYFPQGLFVERPQSVVCTILDHQFNLYAVDKAPWTDTYCYASIVAPNTIGDRALTLLFEVQGIWSFEPPLLQNKISYNPTIELATDQKIQTIWSGSIKESSTITQEGIGSHDMLIAYMTCITQENTSTVPVILSRTVQGGKVFMAGTGAAMNLSGVNNWFKVTLEVIDENTLKAPGAGLDLHALTGQGAVAQGAYVNNRLIALAVIKGSVIVSCEDIKKAVNKDKPEFQIVETGSIKLSPSEGFVKYAVGSSTYARATVFLKEEYANTPKVFIQSRHNKPTSYGWFGSQIMNVTLDSFEIQAAVDIGTGLDIWFDWMTIIR